MAETALLVITIGMIIYSLYRRFFPRTPSRPQIFYQYCVKDGIYYYGYKRTGDETIFIELVFDYEKLWKKKYPKYKFGYHRMEEYRFCMQLGANFYEGLEVVKKTFAGMKLRQYKPEEWESSQGIL